MVGRSKRPYVTTPKETEPASDEDIVCHDFPVRQNRKGKAATKLNMKKKKFEEKINEFAGFDVDDASEDEKRQIREAILASTKDHQPHSLKQQSCEGINGSDHRSYSSQKTESPTSDVIEINSEEDMPLKGNTTPRSSMQESAVQDDDDATQPPSDMEENDFVLNLDQPTLDESREEVSDNESKCIEDIDITLKDDDCIEDIEECQDDKAVDEITVATKRNKNIKPGVSEMEHQEEDMYMSDTVTEDVTSKMPGESEGFAADMDKDDDAEYIVQIDDQCNESQPSKYRHRARRSGSHESLKQSNSEKKGNSSSQKSSSDGSLHSLKDAVTSFGSKSRSRTPSRQSSRSNSQNSEIETEHVPLKRHFRGVRPEALKYDSYFGTSGTEELEKSAMAIYQLFEIYRTKLKIAQRNVGNRIAWPEPVKTGQHQSRTLDIKRRGKESVYIEMSDSEEDILDTKVGRGFIKQQRKVNSKDELAEIIIDSENSNESLTHGRSTRNPVRSNTAENDIMSAETQPYDIDDNDDEDFVIEAKTRARGRPRAGTSKENFTGKQYVTNEKENKVRSTRGRPSKTFSLNREKVASKILVEETQQEEMDLQEALKRSEPETQVSVEETQPRDEDFDWLNVGNIDEKVEFENELHKANLPKFTNQKPHQIYTKSHQKVVFQERNIQKDCLENEQSTKDKFKDDERAVPNSANDRKPIARGRKRKAKKPPVVTLVEDTQDLDAEQSGWNVSQGKRKRNCFKLDSGSEEESIPESQDLDKLSEHGLEEKTGPNRDSGRTDIDNSIIDNMKSTVTNTKDFVSPEKNKMSEENDEEGSQSPIISKKKSFNGVSKKIYAKSNARNNINCEEEPFKRYKANSSEKKFKDANSSNLARNRRDQTSFQDINLQEETAIPEGVKRFIQRPSSKDSNVSDNVSITSSQMSTNILDEEGDLYSTQFCEIKARKGKGFQSKEKSKCDKEDSDEEILSLDVSEDDPPVLKRSKKTNAMKEFSKNVPATKDLRTSVKRDPKFSRMENIQRYFNKVKQPGDVDVPIELDIDSDEDLVEPESTLRNRKNITTGITEHHVEPSGFSNSKSKYRNILNKGGKQKNLKSPKSPVSDIATKPEVKNVKADINDMSDVYDASVQYRNDLSRSKHQVEDTDSDMIDPQDVLNDLDNVSGKERHIFNENISRSRCGTRNIETDTGLFEGRPFRNRRRNVSETVSSTEHEERSKGSTRARIRNQDNSEETGHVRNDGRKRVKDPNISDEDPIGKKKIEKLECPMCSKMFPVSIVEQHAATCEGLVDEDEIDGPMNEEEYIAHITEHHPNVTEEEQTEALPQRQLPHKHTARQDKHSPHQQHMHLHDRDHDPSHTAAVHTRHPCPSEALHGHESVDEAVGRFVHHDEHVIDVAKHLSSSPGEEGELQTCYICDEQVLKGKLFEVHVSRCLAIAAQQQAEVDEKGFSNVYVEPEPEEEVKVRTLRGRHVSNDRGNTPGRGGAPRGRQMADGSPGDRRRHKREICVESRGAGDGEEESGPSLRTEAREVGTFKRGLTKRTNKKMAQNDDGYNSGQVIMEDIEDDSVSGSSWEESSSIDSSDDDNITLASVVKSGSNALITGPWNKNNQSNKNCVNQSRNSNDVPDWVRSGINSPIKSFVPISQQEDSEYFQKQFSYKKDKVESRMNKRKRSSKGGQKRRRKRRKVQRTKKK
ncbi:uncharacterized protein LOC132712959 isoform X2 [Ruditapes philippinarum]|uniref:uncharacterized protein LOC132712959 isoform X2 n=1 Tax=Ruditapes philippinarum TaxID=129788 RepID=UPI00295B9695|nr:uncharacterized protein LOC132712959 isoform X2 [Ruditapes philippinarum]